jgi:nucleotide-binding universal stress UspA family protein
VTARTEAPVLVLHARSAEGEAALLAAVEEAELRGCDLVVVSSGSGSDEPRAAELERQVLHQELAARIPTGLRWSLDVVDPGSDAAGSLVEHVARVEPRLVVLGSRSRSTVGKLLLGRSLQRVLLEVDARILVVKR